MNTRDEQIWEARQSGLTYKTVGAQFGLSSPRCQTIVFEVQKRHRSADRWVVDHGGKPPERTPTWVRPTFKVRNQEVWEARQEGLTFRALAARFGLSPARCVQIVAKIDGDRRADE